MAIHIILYTQDNGYQIKYYIHKTMVGIIWPYILYYIHKTMHIILLFESKSDEMVRIFFNLTKVLSLITGLGMQEC
jgi:hypothetical protein